MLGEAACLFAVQAPSASKFIVRFPVFAISPQKFPGEICSIELVDIVVSGARTPIALLWHPLFSQARVQRELFMRDDSKLCLAWEARRLANVMQIPHHLALSGNLPAGDADRSEEHTSELQSLMRNSYAVLCLKKKKKR